MDPFVDINQPPSTPSTEEGAGAASKGMHGGIAGIIVASVFLGIGALVGLTWFGKGCFFGLYGFFDKTCFTDFSPLPCFFFERAFTIGLNTMVFCSGASHVGRFGVQAWARKETIHDENTIDGIGKK